MKVMFFLTIIFLFSCQSKKTKYLYENEAFVGAPPTINHAIKDYEDCADCHTDDGDEDATQTPHDKRKNCLQCHILTNSDVKPEVKNVFKSGYKHIRMEKKKTETKPSS